MAFKSKATVCSCLLPSYVHSSSESLPQWLQACTHLAIQLQAPDIQQVQLLALAGCQQQCCDTPLTASGACHCQLLQATCGPQHAHTSAAWSQVDDSHLHWVSDTRVITPCRPSPVNCRVSSDPVKAYMQQHDPNAGVGSECQCVPELTDTASAMLLSVLLLSMLWLRLSRCRHSVCFKASPTARPPTSLICSSSNNTVPVNSAIRQHTNCVPSCCLCLWTGLISY